MPSCGTISVSRRLTSRLPTCSTSILKKETLSPLCHLRCWTGRWAERHTTSFSWESNVAFTWGKMWGFHPWPLPYRGSSNEISTHGWMGKIAQGRWHVMWPPKTHTEKITSFEVICIHSTWWLFAHPPLTLTVGSACLTFPLWVRGGWEGGDCLRWLALSLSQSPVASTYPFLKPCAACEVCVPRSLSLPSGSALVLPGHPCGNLPIFQVTCHRQAPHGLSQPTRRLFGLAQVKVSY